MTEESKYHSQCTVNLLLGGDYDWRSICKRKIEMKDA